MADSAAGVVAPALLTADGRPVRVAHLTTIDTSLAVLLGTELQFDLDCGLETYGISAPGPQVRRLEDMGVGHVPVSALTRTWDVGADLRAARELVSVLRELRPDVLHTHNPKTGVLGRVIGRLIGIPVVVNTCHGLWASPEDRPLKRAAVVAAEGVAARFSHTELYQNDTDRRTMRFWSGSAKAHLVGNGIDLTAFRPDPVLRADTRAELGFADHALVVGGVGRLVAEKGVREFAEVARALGRLAEFVWVGSEDPDKADAVRELGPSVRLLGRRDDMPAVLNAFDVFVLPSYREGFSRSAMEAAACQLPMVLSDIRGCREIGDHERELLLVPARDTESLASAIERLLTDELLRARLGAAARSRALVEFDQRRVAEESLRTYARVARSRGLGWHVQGLDEGAA